FTTLFRSDVLQRAGRLRGDVAGVEGLPRRRVDGALPGHLHERPLAHALVERVRRCGRVRGGDGGLGGHLCSLCCEGRVLGRGQKSRATCSTTSSPRVISAVRYLSSVVHGCEMPNPTTSPGWRVPSASGSSERYPCWSFSAVTRTPVRSRSAPRRPSAPGVRATSG